MTMELRLSSCKCNTDGNSVQSCCFNPVIFFVCKFCRGAFENADKLIIHKRQHHSLKDLKGIKFIIFEERFVETDEKLPKRHSIRIKGFTFKMKFYMLIQQYNVVNENIFYTYYVEALCCGVENRCCWHICDEPLRIAITISSINTFRNELTYTVAPLRSKIADNTVEISLIPPLHQDDGPAEPQIDNSIEITNESQEFKLPNPFVHLRRLTSKEINSYLRPTATSATHQNQETEDVDVNDHDERCVSTSNQNISGDNSTTAIAPTSINSCNDSTSNKNVLADLKEFQISRIVEIIHFPNTRSSLCKQLKNKQLKLDDRSAATMTEITENNKMLEFSSDSSIALENSQPASANALDLGLQAKTRTGSSPEQSKISDLKSQNNCMETQTNERIQSHFLTYERNPSAELLTINENENGDLASEIIADGEFIVANVVQSSDGIGIQFVSACAPVIPEKESTAAKLNLNEAVEKQHFCNDIDLLETENSSEYDNAESIALIPEVVSDDAEGPPSPTPVPMEVVPSLTDEVQIKTEYQAAGTISNNSEVAELSGKVNTPQISVYPQTEAEKLVQLSPPSMTRSRPLRNRSKINYSENQTCVKCSRDFYTVEELETHEKLCLKNQNNRKRGQLRKRDLKLVTISDGVKATHADINDTEDIQVIQTAVILPDPNDLEVKVTDSEGDQDYNFPDVISCSSDSEIETGSAELNLGQKKVITDFLLRSPNSSHRKNKVDDKNSGIKKPKISRDIRHNVNETEKPDEYTDCCLSLKDWIMKQKEANPENIILLDPDPFQAEADTNKEAETPAFVVTPENLTKCKLCSMQLTSDLDAKRHLKYCWTNNKTKHVHCPICSKSYVGHNGLWNHNKLKHSKLPKKTLSIKCTICSKVMTSKEGFKNHMEIHNHPNLKPFVCEVCGSGFRNKFKLQHHKLSHSEDRPFKCKLCPKAFKNKEVLRKHRAVHVKDTNYHCLPCNKSFKSKGLLQNHSRYHLKDKWFPCKAEHCDKKFPLKAALWRHCQNEHKELYSQMPKVSCTVCSKQFMINSQLERHMFAHGRERPFRCSEEGCSGTFTTKQSLEEHLRMHTGERPYQCDTCGTTFARQCLFHIHLKQHKTPKVRVLCHLCPKTFSRNWELQQHLTFHEKGRQFGCEKCDSKFMSKSHLKGHMKTHERKGATDDVSSNSSSESEVESEEGTTEESEPESEHDDKKSS